MNFAGRLGVGFLVGLALTNIACGAMFNPSAALIQVNATPPGARIYVDGIYAARAAGTVAVSQSIEHAITVQANGYSSGGTRIEPQTSGGLVALDCLLLVVLVLPGIIALIVDGSTGDWKVVNTDRVTVVLDPAQPPPPAAPAPGAARTGCEYDAQCKGARICRAGECVEPTAPAAPSAPDEWAPPPTGSPNRVPPPGPAPGQ